MRIFILITLLFVSNLSFGQAFGITGGGRTIALTSEDFTTSDIELDFSSNKFLPLNDRLIQDSSYNFSVTNAGASTIGKTIYLYIQARTDSTFTTPNDIIILNESFTSGNALADTTTYLFSFVSNGDNTASLSVSETDANGIPYLLTAAQLSDTSIVLTYSDGIVGTAPAGTAFTFTDDGTPIDIDSVTLDYTSDSTKILLSVDGTISGSTLLLDYTKPSSNPLSDSFGNEARAFTDFVVDEIFNPSQLSPEYYNATLQTFDGTTATDIDIGVIDAHNDDNYEVYVWLSPDDGTPAASNFIYGTYQSSTQQAALGIVSSGDVQVYARGKAYETDATQFVNGGSQPKYINIRVVSGVPSLYVDGSLVAISNLNTQTPTDITDITLYGARYTSGSPAVFFDGQGQHLFIKQGTLSGSDRTNMENFYSAL